jgi:DNA invertase Pin-like site-specific DNA recombinase
MSTQAVHEEAPLRARIYARHSLDREGKRASVARQIEQARDLIRARGWVESGEPFVDESTPASKQRTTTRPKYLAMIDALVRGDFDVPVAHHDDRIWRTISEREAFMWLAADADVPLVATCYGDFQVGHPDDDFRGELNVMLAKRESATIGRRMRSAHLRKAQQGEWPGGPAPFGYRLDPDNKSLVVEPVEAAIIADVAARLLAGEPTLSVANDLVRQGVVPRNSRLGHVANLSRAVQNPALAGLRVHKGETFRALWHDQAILSVADHERLVALFGARKRGPRSTASRNVLAGFLVCELCGAKLTASTSNGRQRYVCPIEGLGGCGKAGVPKAAAEARVLDLVVAELDDPAFGLEVERALATAPDGELAEVAAQLAKDRTQRGVIVDMLADGDMTPADFKRAAARLDRSIADAEAMLARAAAQAGPVVALVGQGEAVRAMWDRPEDEGGYSFVERRTILSAVAERFVVHRAGAPRGPRFDPERISIVPRFTRRPARRRARRG